MQPDNILSKQKRKIRIENLNNNLLLTIQRAIESDPEFQKEELVEAILRCGTTINREPIENIKNS